MSCVRCQVSSESVAAIIVNYNMPERADALARYIFDFIKWPVEVFLVDNGSDIMQPAENTTLWLERNIQTTGGWNAGLDQARDQGEYLAYWFLITSTSPPDPLPEAGRGRDVLSPLARLLVEDAEAVGVHPALTEDSTTAWKHLITRPTPSPSLKGGELERGARRTWMIDNIASLWRAEWFDAQGGFDPRLMYGWGIDLDLSWAARHEGRSLWIHEGCQVKKVTDIGYAMGRMKMTAEERVRLAGANMDQVLRNRYGKNWDWMMRNEFVEEQWR